MHIANIVLNEAPNSSDAMRVGNNVHLTAMGANQFSMVAIQSSCRKPDLPQTRDNDTIIIKIHVDRNKLCLGIEWRLYTQQFRRQVNQRGQTGMRRKFLSFDNFNSVNSKAQLSCLNRFMVLIAQKKEIYGLCLKEMLV